MNKALSKNDERVKLEEKEKWISDKLFKQEEVKEVKPMKMPSTKT